MEYPKHKLCTLGSGQLLSLWYIVFQDLRSGYANMDFSITNEQDIAQLSLWLDEQLKKSKQLASDQSTYDDPSADPYFGAIGGVFTYSFTPTSIGNMISVSCNVTGEKLDLFGDI